VCAVASLRPTSLKLSKTERLISQPWIAGGYTWLSRSPAAVDALVCAVMKDGAVSDTSCELQNPVNQREDRF